MKRPPVILPAALIPFLLIVLLAAPSCRTIDSSPDDGSQQPKPLRISDRYAREAVESYVVYDGSIPQHNLAMVRLKSGERFPMVCRVVAGGVYPIPQSVFAAGGDANHWDIMCEPERRGTFLLMQLNVSSTDGVLRVGRARLVPLPEQPRLLPGPARQSSQGIPEEREQTKSMRRPPETFTPAPNRVRGRTFR